MPEHQQAIRADSADADAVRTLARSREKEDLIREIAILMCRADAIKDLIEDRKGRLEGLMAQDGERERVQAEAEASFSQRRTVKVASVDEVIRRFSKQVLAEHFSPGVAFIEACEKEKVNYEGALIVGVSPAFKVERSRTKAAKELQKKIIEETRAQADETVAKIRKNLREQRGD